MVWSVLWISARVLVFTSLLVPGSGRVLNEGEKCGGGIRDTCDSGLICQPIERHPILFFAEGVCSRGVGCNCSEVECPPWRRFCHSRIVTDPCGCCEHCPKRKGEVCGGPSWRYGNCDSDLVCAVVVGLEPVTPPQLGVCKAVPKHLKKIFPVHLCPVQNGCNVHVGTCDCYTDQACDASFSYSTYEACNKVLMADWMYDPDESKPIEPAQPMPPCMEWRCIVQGCECVCKMMPCTYIKQLYEPECCKILKESGCNNTSCPEIPPPSCPADSFITQPHSEPGQCCPNISAMCTCDFQTCPPKPDYCPLGELPEVVKKGNGHPGTCCDRYECVKQNFN
ncbi:cysteine-rich motor neuron 1 protein-like [Clarias gariepinus]|uniref:cysteine-rich motor neuron 1 protein-like n=1 Tax=Clarias gariepinus TaxID=13013 RepID=UPI00234D04FD|nr:cysteine-rich motor neuron 1 protein-like [Clarias gariepinus]